MKTRLPVAIHAFGALAAAAGLLLAAPAFAQQAGSAPAAGTAAMPSSTAQTPAAPTGPELRLTMQQAVDMGLQTNLGLVASRLNPDATAQDVASARAAFQPVLTSSFSRNTVNQIPGSFTTSGGLEVASASISSSTQLQQVLPFHGLQYGVTWSGFRQTTTAYSSFNPSEQSTFAFNLTQPLWRNFSVDSNRQNLKIEERAAQITDIGVQQQVVTTERSIRMAYLSLVGALAQRDLADAILKLAQTQYKENQERVAVGTMAPADIVADEAAIASDQEQLIGAEGSIATAEDNLRTQVLDPARADYWQVNLVPTDTIDVAPRAVDVDQAITNALKNRTDLVTARKNLEIAGLNIDLAHNATLPQLNATLSYSAQGVGGTQIQYDNSGGVFPPPILSETNRSFTSALGDSFTNQFPSWTYGVAFSYPLGRSQAEAALAKGQVQQKQAQIQLHEQELSVEAQVRAAARNVDTALKQVQAADAAVDAQQKNLDAEQKKFNVGMVQEFEVLTVTNNLALAKQSALSARIAYQQAIINFDAVQRIPQ